MALTKGYIGLITLIALNSGMYLISLYVNRFDAINGLNSNQIIHVGGMYQHSDVWTIFLAIFVHNSLMHFIINMIALYIFGKMVIKSFGSFFLIICYLLGGVLGNVLMIFIIEGGTNCGASGSIFALLGSLFVGSFIPYKTFKAINEVRILIVLLTTIYVFISVLDVSRGTNLYTHFIGLFIGMILAGSYTIIHRKRWLNNERSSE